MFKETADDIKARNYDLGVVVLPGINHLEKFKLLSIKHRDLLKHKVNVTGYPADKKDGLMYTMEGPVKKFNHPHRMFYDIHTFNGNSGSGVWFDHSKEKHCCVGVHTYGIDPDEPYDSNSGTRLTKENIEKVKLWARTLTKLGTY